MQMKEFAHCPLETLLLPLYISTTLYTMQQSNYQRCEQDTKLNSKRLGFQVQGQNLKKLFIVVSELLLAYHSRLPKMHHR